MPLKRIVMVGLLACAACLQAGSPTYAAIDTTPPTIASINPDIALDGGGYGQVNATQTIVVTFSEQMDPTTLRTGIAIRDGTTGQEIALSVQADTLPIPDHDDPTAENPYPVNLASGQGSFAQGIYSLTFRTLLLDSHGVPLAAEQSGAFFVK